MSSSRSYYTASIVDFLKESPNQILGKIHHEAPLSEIKKPQINAWEEEIQILQNELRQFTEGRIIFEYIIPRMGKRVDVVVLHKNIVFLLEFKCGDTKYRSSTYNQVYDYALDLQNFQKESNDKLLVPIMIPTKAPSCPYNLCEKDRIIEPIPCNKSNIGVRIQDIAAKYNEKSFNYDEWEQSQYYPTPTIIEAAQALYQGHNVSDITRNDAGVQNLTTTMNEINRIIEDSKANGRKSICFVTGVPGAGKTLVGLNIAVQRSNAQKGDRAILISGNGPLVRVLQEALARDKKKQDDTITKQDALRSTSAFIQIVHRYRDDFVGNDKVPPERVVVFDEAQRAWTKEKITNFMKTKKGIPDFSQSEPEFLIGTMNRHQGWAVIICLVGGGQEINLGEAGLPEWFDSLRRSFSDWDVYITPQLNDEEYRRDRTWNEMIDKLRVKESKDLHLSTSIRSFRTPELAAFIKSILDADTQEAKRLCQAVKKAKYPIVITRDLNKAKQWVKGHCKGTMRYGLLAGHSALRLKPEGIFVKAKCEVENWFLNEKEDVRSSYALEDVATEFDIQGLELDYSIVAWDADYRYVNGKWTYNEFKGSTWQRLKKEEKKIYLKNAYRVLLTRARQGMAIFVPTGSTEDKTRKQEWYDGIYQYLKEIGIDEI